MPRKAIQRAAAARSATTATTLSEIRPISISVSEPYLSTPRTETTFRARKTASPDEASPLQGDDHKVNILLVDDTPDKLTAHEAVLVDLEQNIVKARSGREALRCLLQQEFAVILLDINMPGMDGFETAELIRQRKATAHTPIIFLTSFSTGDTDVYRGYSLGAVDYLFTPIVPEVLRSKVGVFIDLARQSRQLQRQSEALRRAEQEKLERRLTETTERLEWETRRNHFFRLSIELLAISDYQGVFGQINPTWQKGLGYAEEELKGQSFFSFIHPADEAMTREWLAKITDADTPLYFENRFRARSGDYRWLGWTIAPFAAEGLLYIFARDITERYEREQQIKQLNDDLKKQAVTLQSVNQELESFSYSIAHDLRTPLLAITGYSEMMIQGEAGKVAPDGVQMLRAIHRNSGHMSQLIDDFLAFFRVGRQELTKGYIDMKKIAHEAIISVQPIDGKRQIAFDVAELPAARGDASLVRQVLVNLLANAVKFTGTREKASIQLGHELTDGHCIYHVRDNGVGFDMKHYGKLFNVFQRLHTREEFDGTGIGLAIVQKIVQRHGGKVWADSKPNKGATFFFSLPAAEKR
jgi:PAS domain S-box-containing protein